MIPISRTENTVNNYKQFNTIQPDGFLVRFCLKLKKLVHNLKRQDYKDILGHSALNVVNRLSTIPGILNTTLVTSKKSRLSQNKKRTGRICHHIIEGNRIIEHSACQLHCKNSDGFRKVGRILWKWHTNQYQTRVLKRWKADLKRNPSSLILILMFE